jgi:hypothetical protein
MSKEELPAIEGVETVDSVANPQDAKTIKPVGLNLLHKTNLKYIKKLTDDMPIEIRRQTILDFLEGSIKAETQLSLAQGEALYEIHVNQHWKAWGYESFADFAENFNGLTARSSYMKLKVYQTLIIDLNLDADLVGSLPYTKSHKLLPYLTKDNAEQVIMAVDGLSVSESEAKLMELFAPDPVVIESNQEDESDPSPGEQVEYTSSELAEQLANADGEVVDVVQLEQPATSGPMSTPFDTNSSSSSSADVFMSFDANMTSTQHGLLSKAIEVGKAANNTQSTGFVLELMSQCFLAEHAMAGDGEAKTAVLENLVACLFEGSPNKDILFAMETILKQFLKFGIACSVSFEKEKYKDIVTEYDLPSHDSKTSEG